MDIKKRIAELKELLPVKRFVFANEFLVDLNGTRAATRAGYAKSSAGAEAGRLLADVRVAELVALLKLERSKRTEVTLDRVVKELARLAFADERGLTWVRDPDGEKLTLAPAVDEKIKIKALELLGKHTAAFTENLNLTNNGGDMPTPTTSVNISINHRRRAEELAPEPTDEDLLS